MMTTKSRISLRQHVKQMLQLANGYYGNVTTQGTSVNDAHNLITLVSVVDCDLRGPTAVRAGQGI